MASHYFRCDNDEQKAFGHRKACKSPSFRPWRRSTSLCRSTCARFSRIQTRRSTVGIIRGLACSTRWKYTYCQTFLHCSSFLPRCVPTSPLHARARARRHLLVLRSSTRAPTSFPTYKYEQLAFHVCKGSVHARTRCEMEWNRMLMFNRASSNLLEVQAGETWRFFAKKIGIADIK